MTRTLSFLGSAFVIATIVWSPARTAHAWEWFRSSNGNVDKGNALLEAGKHKEALAAYDKAARELPSEPTVQLNRGLALLALGESEKAKEAFLRGAEPPATREVQADAYYNLGLSYYKDGDAAAGNEDHEAAQAAFREAADAFRRSLRAMPGNGDAGWNLELALRRLQEEKGKAGAKGTGRAGTATGPGSAGPGKPGPRKPGPAGPAESGPGSAGPGSARPAGPGKPGPGKPGPGKPGPGKPGPRRTRISRTSRIRISRTSRIRISRTSSSNLKSNPHSRSRRSRRCPSIWSGRSTRCRTARRRCNDSELALAPLENVGRRSRTGESRDAMRRHSAA